MAELTRVTGAPRGAGSPQAEAGHIGGLVTAARQSPAYLARIGRRGGRATAKGGRTKLRTFAEIMGTREGRKRFESLQSKYGGADGEVTE
jgi:hypothetical protein